MSKGPYLACFYGVCSQILKALVGWGRGEWVACTLTVQACAIGRCLTMVDRHCDCRNGNDESSPRRSFHRTTLFPTLISRGVRDVFGGILFSSRLCRSQPFFFTTLFFFFFSVREAFGVTLEGGDCASCCQKPQLCVRLYCISNLLSSYYCK